MPTRRQVLQLGAFGGAVLGTAAGWTAGALSAPALEAPLASAGTYAGQKAASRLAESETYRRFRQQRAVAVILRGKAQMDLERMCIQSPSSVARALRASNDSLRASQVISNAQLRHRSPDVLDDLDYSGCGGPEIHIRELAKAGNTFLVSCPALFVGAMIALNSLSQRLARYGIQLTIDTRAISSKEQIRHLSRDDHIDFAIMAESAYYLSSGTMQVTSEYSRVMPCYSQEDCLLAVGGDTGPNWSSKIYFHEGSTAEVALRSGPLWGRRSTRSALDTAGDIVPLIASLDRSAFVTAWEPITTVMTTVYTDVTVVPGSRFEGYVSLFARNEWFKPSNHKALTALTSLLINESKKLKLTRGRLSEVAKPTVIDALDELCGISFLGSG